MMFFWVHVNGLYAFVPSWVLHKWERTCFPTFSPFHSFPWRPVSWIACLLRYIGLSAENSTCRVTRRYLRNAPFEKGIGMFPVPVRDQEALTEWNNRRVLPGTS